MSLPDPFAHVAAFRSPRKDRAAGSRGTNLPVVIDRLAGLLGGETRRNRYGAYLSLRQWYATPEMHLPSERSLALLLSHVADDAAAMAELASDPEKWLFLDVETTGLAGGTGTYAFLVGLGWWDAGGLQVEQFFMHDLDEEHPILLELSARMAERPVLVTFNGKSFDWPLLETRYRMTRAIPPRPPRAHLDLLHPARQLWRLRLGSVRLKELEARVLAGEGRPLEWSRRHDIDSSLIPQIYFDYLRGGPAEPLVEVFRHNQMDLRGLAALAGTILTVVEPGHAASHGAGRVPQDPLDLYGLSRLLRRRGERARAREVCERALRGGLPQPIERLARRDQARLAKQMGDFAAATSLWEQLRRPPARGRRRDPAVSPEEAQTAFETSFEAAEQLAMYFEHRARQPLRALELTRTAISELLATRSAGHIEPGRARKFEQRLARRLARLERRVSIGEGS